MTYSQGISNDTLEGCLFALHQEQLFYNLLHTCTHLPPPSLTRSAWQPAPEMLSHTPPLPPASTLSSRRSRASLWRDRHSPSCTGICSPTPSTRMGEKRITMVNSYQPPCSITMETLRYNQECHSCCFTIKELPEPQVVQSDKQTRYQGNRYLLQLQH